MSKEIKRIIKTPTLFGEEKMKKFDKTIFEGTEYLTDINELHKITKNIGILSILSINDKEFDNTTKGVIIQKIANY